MNVRTLALTLPLALAACSHTGQTGAMSRPPAEGQQASGGGAAGAPIAQDPLFRPGPSIQGHADDQIVAGRISEATDSSLTIRTPQGEQRTLQIVPQTTIELDGQDAAATDLTEGQPVRASFEVVEGQEVAVKIRAGDRSAGASEATEPGAGASQDLGTGSSSSDDASDRMGPAPAPAAPDPQTAPDAGWGPPAGHGAGEDSAGRPQPR